MKEVVAHWTPQEFQTVLTALIAAIGAVIVGIVNAIQNHQITAKLETHDARSAARAREAGQLANPPVTEADRGHLK